MTDNRELARRIVDEAAPMWEGSDAAWHGIAGDVDAVLRLYRLVSRKPWADQTARAILGLPPTGGDVFTDIKMAGPHELVALHWALSGALDWLNDYEVTGGLAMYVIEEMDRQRARKIAREILDREDAAANPLPPFDVGTLGEILARPADPPARVEDLIPWEAGTLVVAQRKTGKTTLGLNLVRSLDNGETFLGRFHPRRVSGRIAILNYEVSGATIARWASEAGIDHERLVIANLRGRRNPLAHPGDRAALAETLRNRDVETLIVDPFGRAYTGKSQNDAGEVGAFLGDLDRWARGDVGAKDVVLIAHAGWDGERSRGSSALEDWADSIVTLTKGDEDRRYLRAIGRDVDLPEDELTYDEATRRLTLTGNGSRKAKSAARAVDDAILEVVAVLGSDACPDGGMSATELRGACSCAVGATDKARRKLVQSGRVVELPAPKGRRGGGKVYRLAESVEDLTYSQPRPTPTNPDGVGVGTPTTPSLRVGVPQSGFNGEPRPADQEPLIATLRETPS